MELIFRYAAIIALLARIGAAYYCRKRTLSAATSSAVQTGPQRVRFTGADVMLFSNIWVTIALTFWVTTFVIGVEHPTL